MKNKTKTFEVEIFGQRLALQGGADERYVQELVQYVEGQMRIAAKGLTTTTTGKVAILAAINITDQLFQQEKRRQTEEAEVEHRAIQLMETIESQLNTHN